MNQEDIFSIEKDTIEINGMDTLVQFTRYNPYDTEIFLDGLELSEDLTNKFGTILYSKGTEMTPTHIARLVELRESNPTMDFYFRIERSARLIQTFRNEIKEQIFTIFNRQKRANVYSDFLTQLDANLDNFIDEVLSEENITLLLYQMRFICQTSEKNKSALFMEHPINAALISLAIASSKIYEKVIGKSKTKLIDVCKAALFHNYGALRKIDTILEAHEDHKFNMYWEANRDGYSSMDNIELSHDIKDALKFIYEYHTGRRDFINKADWPAIMANIVLVSIIFLQKESGMFGEPQKVRKIVDRLNVRVAEKELNERAVRALTYGLNLQDLFDFYKELNDLIRMCPLNSAVPYPLVGFKSPTIFICKKEVLECKFIETSMKAVNLLHPMGELKKGKYRRCRLLTPRLIAFYKKHYRAIKGIANGQVTGLNE